MTDASAVPRIGLEVHARLRTRTKCFCACAVDDAAADGPNAHVCPTCAGLPGALPVLGEEALRLAVRAAVALGCSVPETTWWERKHYGYPDLPKGYQITQQTRPLGTGGTLRFDGPDGPSSISLRRVHLEEDAGRTHHGDTGTLLDFGRAGSPLLEIVTEPDLRSADEVRGCLVALRRLLRWIEVSDADMESGGMRCEPNVNVVLTRGEESIVTPIVEIKNLNSIAATVAAVLHEVDRQVAEFTRTGTAGPGPRTTRGWDEERRRTVAQRSKESAADYRFLVEPDLPPVQDLHLRAEAERRTLPELPLARRERLVQEAGVPPDLAATLCASRDVADWFDEVARADGDAAHAARWVTSDVLGIAHRKGVALPDLPVTPALLGDVLRAVRRGRLPRDAARSSVLPRVLDGHSDWRAFAAEQGLDAASDDEVAETVREVLEEHAVLVERARSGRVEVLDALVGIVMQRTRGRASGAHVQELIARLVTRVTEADPPPE